MGALKNCLLTFRHSLIIACYRIGLKHNVHKMKQ